MSKKYIRMLQRERQGCFISKYWENNANMLSKEETVASKWLLEMKEYCETPYLNCRDGSHRSGLLHNFPSYELTFVLEHCVGGLALPHTDALIRIGNLAEG